MRCIPAILLLATALSTHAAPSCNAHAAESSEYLYATRTVGDLPELHAWSKTHPFSVSFGAATDNQLLIAGRCYWSVSVYATRPERLELWHIFYVRRPRGVELIQDPLSGEPISLVAWRKRGTQSRMKK